MRQRKSKFIGLMLTASLALSLGLPAVAAEYPTKHITMIIPMAAGGPMDMAGRALANSAKKFLGQPIICENMGGGGGTVGSTIVVKKPADGYSLVFFSSISLNINWHMREMNFHPVEDMTFIIRVSGVFNGLVVHADSQWKTIQEFVQYAKQNPQKISYGTGGVGIPPHLAMEELAVAAGGIQWTHVPYKGAAEACTAVLGSHVDAACGASGWAPLVDAGKLRLLTTFTPFRSARYPQVPTLKEIGYDIAYPAPVDIMGPKGLPKPIVKKLHDAFKNGMEDPEFQAVLKKLDMFPIYLNSEDLEKASRQEFEQVGKIIQKLGLQKK